MVQCIVKKRADKQIRYVANNMTSMQIGLTLPNVEQFADEEAEAAFVDNLQDFKTDWQDF